MLADTSPPELRSPGIRLGGETEATGAETADDFSGTPELRGIEHQGRESVLRHTGPLTPTGTPEYRTSGVPACFLT